MKNEKVIRQKDQREISSEAMRTLVRMAQAKIEKGVAGALPEDTKLKAKDYYRFWLKRQPLGANRLIAFFVVLVSLFFLDHSIESATWELVIFSFVAFVTYLLESGKKKSDYIGEMLGDLSGIPRKKASIYIAGLLEELWGVKEEKIQWKFQAVSAVFFAGSIFLACLSDVDTTREIWLSFSVISAVMFFSPSMIGYRKST